MKNAIWFILAAAAFLFGLRHHNGKKIAEADADFVQVTARATELSKATTLMREKLQIAEAEGKSMEDYEGNHNANLAKLAEAQKDIEALTAKWPAIESDRAAAVQAVREKELTRPPETIVLTDGTKLENFVVRKIPDEKTVAVEHASGVVKIPAEKLPTAMKERLAFGWQPFPPATISIDKDGNAIVKQATEKAMRDQANIDTAKELNIAEKDSTSIGGVTRALAITEAQLERTEKAFEEERINIRRISIFKPDARDAFGKPYAMVKKEANARLSSLAGRIKALRAERSELEYKLKSL